MSHPQISDPSVENQLFSVLKLYFTTRLSNSEDFTNWFNEINIATYGWKVMTTPNAKAINDKYDVPDWFMMAIHATI